MLAHELGHVKNRDILISPVAATIAGAITMIAQMAQWSAIFGGFGHSDDEEGVTPAAGGRPDHDVRGADAAMLIQMAISRAREYSADETGAQIHGDPESLASALEKLEYSKQILLRVNPAASHLFIVKPWTAWSAQELFSTHPPGRRASGTPPPNGLERPLAQSESRGRRLVAPASLICSQT